MRDNHLWLRAKDVPIPVSETVGSGVDLGFDQRIPMETQKELRSFVKWVEQNFSIPITLWVDFEYKHDLLRKDGKRVGYLFYWADFPEAPGLLKEADIPKIRLPVRTEFSTIEEILRSFAEAVTDYFAWICREIQDDYEVDAQETEEVLQAYRKCRQ